MPRVPARAVVFDNDGLLLDTEPCWTRAQTELFRRRGRVFDLAGKHALVGTSPKAAAVILEQLLQEPGLGKELSAELYALALEEIANGAAAQRGAVELIAELRGKLPLAVASNAPRRHLLTGLRRVGLEDAFDVLLGVDDVANPKPAPDLYASACKALGVRPSQAIALEDSPPGVAAAHAAGLFVVGIPSVPGVVLDADVVASSLEDGAVRAALGLDGVSTGHR